MCRISFYQTLCLYVLRPRFCTSLSVYSRLLPDYSASLSKYGVVGRDPIEVLCALSVDCIGILYHFFDWILSRKSGKKGRKLQKIKKRSSLGTYWKVFRLVYERATGAKIDGKTNRSMHKVTALYLTISL